MVNREISDLSASLVPHRQWAVRQWFYANPIWYYHRPSSTHDIRPSGRFYQLVDPALREVCHLLNDAGAHTTPSCQGHSHPREHFERIWQELRREEPLIRAQGLIVKDCENDEPCLFCRSDYHLPWGCFEDFYRDADAHQNVGYLGIIVPNDRSDLLAALEEAEYTIAAAGLCTDERVATQLGGMLFEVRVETKDSAIRAAQWRAFTESVSRALAVSHAK